MKKIWLARAGVLALVMAASGVTFVLVAGPGFFGFGPGGSGPVFAKKNKQPIWVNTAVPSSPGAPSSLDFIRASVVSAVRAVKSVTAILTPEEARRLGRGVELEEALPGNVSVAESRGEAVASALQSVETPGFSKGRPLRRSSGRIAPQRAAKLSRDFNKVLASNLAVDGPRAVAQLAWGRKNGELARRRTVEGAATGTGLVYDGSQEGRLSPAPASPAVDPASVVRIPALEDEAQKAESDVLQCRQADQRYGPLEERLSADYAKKAAGNAPAEQVRQACQSYNDARCRHILECPLTASDGCPAVDCGLSPR